MRVIAGSARGRPLRTPRGLATRPTSDRVREALFSALSSAGMVEGARVLDLYAGSGALGIEALSRGARHATFVEADRRAVAVIERNLAATGLAGSATVHAGDVWAFREQGPFGLVLADPPYAHPLPAVYGVIARLDLDPGAAVVVERDKRDPHLDAPRPARLALDRSRAYGDTVLLFLTAQEPET